MMTPKDQVTQYDQFADAEDIVTGALAEICSGHLCPLGSPLKKSWLIGYIRVN